MRLLPTTVVPTTVAIVLKDAAGVELHRDKEYVQFNLAVPSRLQLAKNMQSIMQDIPMIIK